MRSASIKASARRAAHVNAKEQLLAANAKFHAGKDPLEMETMLTKIQPNSRQQLDQMTELLELTYPEPRTAQQQQALDLWKFQIASGTVVDQVKFQFLRRFYFWLLGRGDVKDHEKTLWGRANSAVHNREVAAYIDQFIDKRAQYAMKLNMLSMNVPTSLVGYYLYFKYIVNGALRRVNRPDGTSFWDMSNEDYLEDFDMFRQVLDVPNVFGEDGQRQVDHGSSAYADLIAPQAERQRVAPSQKPFVGVEQYPITQPNLARSVHPTTQAQHVAAINPIAVQQNIAAGIDDQLQLSSSKKRMPTVKNETPEEVDTIPRRNNDTMDKSSDAVAPAVPIGGEPSFGDGSLDITRNLIDEFMSPEEMTTARQNYLTEYQLAQATLPPGASMNDVHAVMARRIAERRAARAVAAVTPPKNKEEESVSDSSISEEPMTPSPAMKSQQVIPREKETVPETPIAGKPSADLSSPSPAAAVPSWVGKSLQSLSNDEKHDILDFAYSKGLGALSEDQRHLALALDMQRQLGHLPPRRTAMEALDAAVATGHIDPKRGSEEPRTPRRDPATGRFVPDFPAVKTPPSGDLVSSLEKRRKDLREDEDD